MSRFVPVLAVFSAMAIAVPAHAADDLDGFYDDFRQSYEPDWDLSDEGDPLDFEFGLRYWYSMGAHRMAVAGQDYSADDTSHIVELHGRIDDNSTATYLKGQAGMAAVIEGTYNTPATGGTDTQMDGGTVAYAGADFGYMPLGNETVQAGGFVGYQYNNESPDMGRVSFTTSSGGGDSEWNTLNLQQLRLGVTGRAEVNSMVDLNVQAAAIPYARLEGTYGAFSSGTFTSGGTTYEQGSAGTIEGNLYGASGEIMLGFHPTTNMALRVGGRASYLTGPATVYFTGSEVGNPGNRGGFFSNTTNLEFLRYGLLAELTGTF